MQTVDHLLLLVPPFCRSRQISESRLSTLLFNDGKRVGAMRKRNGDIGSRKLLEAFQWFSDHWPTDAEWPDEVFRPELTSPAPPSSAPPAAEQVPAS